MKNLPTNVIFLPPPTPPSPSPSEHQQPSSPPLPLHLRFRAEDADYLLRAADNLPSNPVVAQCHPDVFLPNMSASKPRAQRR